MPVHGEDGLKEISVYAHVPFCTLRCGYCDFNSTAVGSAGPPEGRRYADCLVAEYERVVGSERLCSALVASVYVGGGTPTVLSARTLSTLVTGLIDVLPTAPGVEVTVEANPESVSEEKLSALLGAGVNRLSLGVQSLIDTELRTLGRAHTASDARGAFKAARRAGFTNLGLDLIFSVPGSSPASWKRSLEGALSLEPEHISLYGLTIEENTPFHGRYTGAGARELPGEREWALMYKQAIETLTGAGYEHYEISNFAQPGRESVHNTGYWIGRSYVGVGAGAHSYLARPGWGRRWSNVADTAAYMAAIESGTDARESSETLGRGQALAEYVMLSLRMLKRGLDVSGFTERFGVSPIEAFGARLEALVDAGLLESDDRRVVLTDSGVMVADSVIAELVSGGPEASPGG